MSFHIVPSKRLQAIIDAHVGPPPAGRLRKGEKPTADHPYLAWHVEPPILIGSAVHAYVSGHQAEIEARPCDEFGQHVLGEVPLEVLGHPCRWVQASCIPILGSFLGEVVLEEELADLSSNVVRFRR
jgi:hypothetical protein